MPDPQPPPPDQPPDQSPAQPPAQPTPRPIGLASNVDPQRRRILRAANFAQFNAITLYIFGGVSAMFAVMQLAWGTFDLIGIIIAVALLASGWHEWRGRTEILAGNLNGPRRLVWNQFALMLVLTAYFALCIATVNASELTAAMDKNPEIRPMLEPMVDMFVPIVKGIYALILLGVLASQLLLIAYYKRTGTRMAKYLAS